MSTTTNAMLQTLVFWKPRGWFGWNNKLHVRTLEHNLLNHSTCSINPLHTFFGWSEPSTYLICLQLHPSVSLMITWITEFLPSVNDNVSWTAGVDIGPMSHLLGTQIFQETWIQSPEAWVTPYLSSHQCVDACFTWAQIFADWHPNLIATAVSLVSLSPSPIPVNMPVLVR